MRESHRGVWRVSQRRKKKNSERETAGMSRQGEIKPKAPPAGAANGSSSPT